MNMPAPHIAAPTIVDALREVACIAYVKTTALGLTRTDKRLSAEIDQAKGAKSGTTNAKAKRLALDDLHNALVASHKEAQENVKFNSTPMANGRHLLPNVNFERTIGKHYEIQQKHDGYLVDLEANADTILQASYDNLKGYTVRPPSKEELLKAYSMQFKSEPIAPNEYPGHVPAAEAWLKRQYEANMEANYQEATNAALGRLIKPLGHLVERIDIYEKNQTDEAKEGKSFFREAVLGNVQELLDVMGTFNLMHDPAFQAFVDQCELFRTVSTEDLKKNGDLRASVKTRAQQVIESLGGWLGPIPTGI